jgi:hypothetical protein
MASSALGQKQGELGRLQAELGRGRARSGEAAAMSGGRGGRARDAAAGHVRSACARGALATLGKSAARRAPTSSASRCAWRATSTAPAALSSMNSARSNASYDWGPAGNERELYSASLAAMSTSYAAPNTDISAAKKKAKPKKEKVEYMRAAPAK